YSFASSMPPTSANRSAGTLRTASAGLGAGLVGNGILLYGPRGTGKTFLARATAGEFGLHFEYVSAPKLLTRWIGATGENIQGVFAQAAGRKPVLFFIGEI